MGYGFDVKHDSFRLRYVKVLLQLFHLNCLNLRQNKSYADYKPHYETGYELRLGTAFSG